MGIIEIAASQVGYLEKKSNNDLESFTGNAGGGNYTKYGAWYGMNGNPWCEMFVSWCANEAGVADEYGKYAYVPYHVSFFRKKGEYRSRGSGYTPTPGDVIFFGDEEHVGLVEYVKGGYVHTIEGNSQNYGKWGVWRHVYRLTSTYIMGYGCPNKKEGEKDLPKFAERVYKNGSTPETVYSCTDKAKAIGELNPYEECKCLGEADGMHIVVYAVDGTAHYKAGFVEYEGRG